MVTENIGDFSTIADSNDQRGAPHHGLVLIEPASYARGHPRTIGRLVTLLDRLPNNHRGDAATSSRHWL